MNLIRAVEELDQNLLKTLSRYPGLRDFYEFSTWDELLLPPKPVGPEGGLPIYLLRDPVMVEMLEEKLPPSYLRRINVGPKGCPHIWLLTPSK